MDIQVLGTTFNVCAYEKENIQTVVLVTGKVEVKTNNYKYLFAYRFQFPD